MAYAAARRTVAAAVTRSLTSSNSSLSSRSRFAVALLNKQHVHPVPDRANIPTRSKTSGSGYSPLNDASPNWSNRPPKETILLDGCDYEHWLIVLEFPDPKPSEEEMINSYVKTLAAVVGSEEEAKKKIYSVSTTTYTGFGALISEELSLKVKGLPNVLWVLPDSYLDVPKKDYGGDLYIDGKVIPRPQYRYNERQQQTRNRPRPRYDRRRETMQAERRGPMQGPSSVQDQRGPMQGPSSVQDQRGPMQGPSSVQDQRGPMEQTTQNAAQAQSMNQGEFNSGNA